MRLFHRNYNKTNNCLMVRYTENVIIQMILLIFNQIKKNEIPVEKLEINIENEQLQAFDIKAMIKIFKYLTSIINPNKIDTTQDLREFGLRLINVSLETAGEYLNNYPSLIKIIQNDLYRQLLINSQSHNFIILSLTLRIIFDLFNYVKEQIRVQLEVFFHSIHLRIAQSNSSSFEQKELILESIVEFCREPDLIIGLYTNYDCKVGSTHLFEDLCKFLLNKATIDNTDTSSGQINNLHLIAAEGILAIIDCIARKFIHSNDNNPDNMHENKEEYDQIAKEKQRKKLLKLSAKHFNNGLSKSFKALQEIGTFETPVKAVNVAQFLLTNPYLDKVKIGEFFGQKKKNDKFNIDVLKQYVELFDFKNVSPDEAMRYFLESFFLHGEAQEIGRIIECFSNKLYDDRNKQTSPLKSEDAACILSFSMIQLNTDAHNHQVKKKMTFAQYKRNLKGQNLLKGQKTNGDSFPEKFLSKIYYSIINNEIKVRSGNFKDIFNYDYYIDENDDDSGYNSDDNISVSSSVSRSSFFSDPITEKQSQKLHKFSTCAPPANGREMFNIVWEPALSILQFHLRYSAGHPKVFDRVVQGIQTLAKIAQCYQISAAFNAIIHSLCNHLILCLWQFGIQNQLLPTTFDASISTKQSDAFIYSAASDLAENDYASISVPYFLSATQSIDVDAEQMSSSEDPNILAIDIRIIYIIKVFFGLVKQYGGVLLTDGWASVMKVLLWLFHLDLLPHSLFEMEDFTDSQGEPLPSLSDPISEDNMKHVDSDVSTLTSWISNAFGSIFTAPTNEVVPNYLEQQPDGLYDATVESFESNSIKPPNSDDIGQIILPNLDIVNAIIECEINDIFTSSNMYHIKSFVRFVQTLISLSNTECNTTVTASSDFELNQEEKQQLMDPISDNSDEKKWNNNNINNKRRLTTDMKIFCLERLSQVLSSNMDRMNNNKIWKLITDHFRSLIMVQQNNALKQLNIKYNNDKNDVHMENMIRHNHYFFERITVNVLKLCVELTETATISQHIESVSLFLNLFSTLDDSILVIVGRRIIAGIKLLLNIQLENVEKEQCFKHEKDWKIILFLMKRFANTNNNDKQCCLDAFHLIELISKKHLKIMNFNFVLNALVIFGKYDINAPIHNTRVIEIILAIHSKLILISNNNEVVLAQMWHKTLSNIALFCANNDYITRRFAINSLHKALLQYPIKINNKNSFIEHKLLFQTVLLPLLLRLTKIENERINNNNSEANELELNDNDDLRLKLLTLIFQVFLHDITMNMFVEYDNNFNILWYNFLNKIREFIFMVQENDKNKNNGINIKTHCCELVKNVILIFQKNKSGNIFQILSNQTDTNVWDQTWQILNDVAPNLKKEFVQ